jgi:nucleoside-diphosphate-sugar epimerase
MVNIMLVGAGFLGKYIIHDFLTKDVNNEFDKIIAVDILPKEVWLTHPLVEKTMQTVMPGKLEYREVTAGNALTLKEDFKNGIDGIIYTAAIADVPVVEKNPDYAIEINEVHLARFIEVLRAFDFNGSMVLMSSESVYGKQPVEKLHITESKYRV